MIRFQRASVTTAAGLQALKDVDGGRRRRVRRRRRALRGGKSTLVRAVNGLVLLTSGNLEVNGINVNGLSRRQMRSLRADIGMIFQSFNLVNRTTVLNNVLMGLHRVPTWRTLLGLYPRTTWRSPCRRSSVSRSSRRPTCGLQPVRRAAPTCRHRQGARPAAPGHPRRRAGGALDPPTSHVVMRDLQRINRELGSRRSSTSTSSIWRPPTPTGSSGCAPAGRLRRSAARPTPSSRTSTGAASPPTTR